MTDQNPIQLEDDQIPSIISLDDQSSFEEVQHSFESIPRKFSNENGHQSIDISTEEDQFNLNGNIHQTKEEDQFDEDEIPSSEPIVEQRRISSSSDQPINNYQTNQEHQFGEDGVPSSEQRRVSSSSDHLMNNDETKPQRQIDEDEIPPSEPMVDPIPIVEQRRVSSDHLFNDDRPLTDLEKPFEHKEEIVEDYSLNESIPIEMDPITLSEFLPGVVHQTNEREEEKVDVELENGSNEVNPSDFTAEDFPPLPPPANLVPAPLYDQEYPPLSATKTTTEKEEEEIISSPPQDLLGNRTLFKQTVVKGKPNTRPTRSTMVTISYELSLVNSLTSENRLIEKISNERYFVSEGDFIPAIDISIQSMDRGEIALIDSDVRHCYGDIGCEEKQLPPTTSLNPYRMKIHIELHDWINPMDIQFLSIHDRIHWGEKKKQMGNFYYRRQDYPNALQSYQGARRFLDTDLNPLSISFDQSDKSILTDQLNQVLNNLAQVYLLMNNNQSCLDAVNRVLQTDSKNIKALFRQGKALFQLGSYEQAIQSLKNYTKINTGTTNHQEAFEMISICEQKLANYKKDQKEMYQRMFQTQNQQKQTTTTNQIDHGNSALWGYVAIGSIALAAIGLFVLIKSRKTW